MKRLFSVLLIASALAVPSFAAKVTFRASMAGSNEVPASASAAWGVGNMELDPATGAFHLVVNLKNFRENLNASHIHIAPAGSNGGAIFSLGGESAYRRSAGKNLHAVFNGFIPVANIEALLTNGCYLNFHTTTYPGGATRGQLIAKPVSLWAELLGANEVPARPSLATGYAAITYNPGTKIISVSIAIENFANTLTGSHIHLAPVGANGGVTLGLGPEASYVRVVNSLTGEFLNLVYPGTSRSLLTEGTYVNIHSNVWPGGEIRGQIVGN